VAAKVVLPNQDFFFLSVLTGRGGVGSASGVAGFWLFRLSSSDCSSSWFFSFVCMMLLSDFL
jgi:hypothetical protein